MIELLFITTIIINYDNWIIINNNKKYYKL